MWTAPASREVPVLSQLDMKAPRKFRAGAKKRAQQVLANSKATHSSYASRSSLASLRKSTK
jgi:hypothetical protein